MSKKQRRRIEELEREVDELGELVDELGELVDILEARPETTYIYQPAQPSGCPEPSVCPWYPRDAPAHPPAHPPASPFTLTSSQDADGSVNISVSYK